MRWALGVEYDGSAYHGWQMQQDGVRSIQQTVEEALSYVADHSVQIVCAGRTDAGVHASGQVIHFDSTAERSARGWLMGANTRLPPDISLRWAQPVAEDFHARYSALSRRYRYFIFNHPMRHALYGHYLTWQYRPLDEKRMHEAAQYLLGEQDFTSLRAAGCQSKTPWRNIMSVEVSRCGHIVLIDITANAFLHHMVRNIAGVLMQVGCGRRDPVWVRELLQLRERAQAPATAPAYGLYMVDVAYPEHFALPANTLPGPHFWN